MLPDVERIYPMLSDVVRMLTMTTTIYRFMMIHDFTDLCNATKYFIEDKESSRRIYKILSLMEDN